MILSGHLKIRNSVYNTCNLSTRALHCSCAHWQYCHYYVIPLDISYIFFFDFFFSKPFHGLERSFHCCRNFFPNFIVCVMYIVDLNLKYDSVVRVVDSFFTRTRLRAHCAHHFKVFFFFEL